MALQDLPVSLIVTDAGTQTRAAIDRATVEQYAERIKAGDQLQPPTVFFEAEEKRHLLSKGFHRVEAYKLAGQKKIACIVKPGGVWEAIVDALGDNERNGLRRSNDDKRHEVSVVLSNPSGAAWSDREIARRVAVSHPFVAEIRRSLESVTSEKSSERTYTTKHGTPATMNTGNIGRPKPAESDQNPTDPLANEGSSDTSDDATKPETAPETTPATPTPPPPKRVNNPPAPDGGKGPGKADASPAGKGRDPETDTAAGEGEGCSDLDPDPWQAYNEKAARIASTLKELWTEVEAMMKAPGVEGLFGSWLNPVEQKKYFLGGATQFEHHQVKGWASERRQASLPDNRPFLYAYEKSETPVRRRGVA